MNYKINTIKDFHILTCTDEEINENTWDITLKKYLANSIAINELQNFIKALLFKKRDQVAEYNAPATCYLWVDE